MRATTHDACLPAPCPEEPETVSSPFSPSHLSGRTIAVIKFSGWGTLLELSFLLEGLRGRFRDSTILLVTDRANEPFAERLPWTDRILYKETSRKGFARSLPGLLELGARLRAQSPELIVDLQLWRDRRLSLALGIMSGARWRMGFVSAPDRARWRLLTHPVYFNPHRSAHRAMEQASLLLGLPGAPAFSPDSFLKETSEERGEVLRALAGLPGEVPLLVMNPNTSDRAPERRWPADSFREAATRLLKRHPSLRIALCGSEADRQSNARVLDGIAGEHDRLYNLAGRLSIGGLTALLRRADVFLSNDSGPLHLAIRLRTPTVALFGPTRPDLVLPESSRSRLIVLYDPHYCSPCLYHVSHPPCDGNNVCLTSLSVDRVVFAVESMIRRHSPSEERTGISHLPLKTTDHQGIPLGRFQKKGRDPS